MDHRHRHNNDVEEEHRVVVHKGELVPTFCNFIPTIHLVFKSDLQPFWLHRCPLLELLSCCILLANSDPKNKNRNHHHHHHQPFRRLCPKKRVNE